MTRSPFENALTVISTEWVSQDRRFPVRLNRILYAAWKADRLEDCRTLLAQGHIAPPVDLVGFKLGRQTWYSVSDGMHRCAARAEAGLPYINARVGGYHICDPQAFLLWRGAVWRERPGGVREWSWDPTPETMEELKKLGVREEQT